MRQCPVTAIYDECDGPIAHHDANARNPRLRSPLRDASLASFGTTDDTFARSDFSR